MLYSNKMKPEETDYKYERLIQSVSRIDKVSSIQNKILDALENKANMYIAAAEGGREMSRSLRKASSSSPVP